VIIQKEVGFDNFFYYSVTSLGMNISDYLELQELASELQDCYLLRRAVAKLNATSKTLRLCMLISLSQTFESL